MYFHTVVFSGWETVWILTRQIFSWCPTPAGISEWVARTFFSLRKICPADVRVPLHSSKTWPHFEFCLEAVTCLENIELNAIPRWQDSFAKFNALSFLDFSRALKALRTASRLLSMKTRGPEAQREDTSLRPSFHHTTNACLLLTFELFPVTTAYTISILLSKSKLCFSSLLRYLFIHHLARSDEVWKEVFPSSFG